MKMRGAHTVLDGNGKWKKKNVCLVMCMKNKKRKKWLFTDGTCKFTAQRVETCNNFR